jgi:transaldolase / glucose-6-phosphate isomerase
MNLKDLRTFGQSLWLDYIRRHLLASGELGRLLSEDGVSGVTSNPSIFEKAIAGSTDYDEAIARATDTAATTIYERLAIDDIRHAADVLRPVFDDTAGADGYACLEVSPHLAHDTEATVREARRLWAELSRPNCMIKVPGTEEGLPAIARLVAEGISVNITLLFSRQRCREVAEAYMAGLETLVERGGQPARVASVASMFVSRIDVAVERTLPAQSGARELVGRVAIANAKLAYQDWKEIIRSPRWQALARRGAKPQRLLWASTSTKDPRESDVMYVEALIGPDTVDTVPPATLDAMRDHGKPRASLEEGLAEAREVLVRLGRAGVSLDDVMRRLEEEGVEQFSSAFDKLMQSIERKRSAGARTRPDRLEYRLSPLLTGEVAETLDEWQQEGNLRRLWARDATLWTGDGESRWLDWLNIADDELASLAQIESFAREVRNRGISHVVVLGMGGSSLCPSMLAKTFARPPGCPELLILDSTDPGEIRALEASIAPDKTLFIVSSKSGSTLEPSILADYFYEKVCQSVGRERAGRQFVAITDPGSPLTEIAAKRGFAKVFFGRPGIGGRYSALSNFGMVPAALMGVDASRLLELASRMAHACASCVPASDNPGAVLGAILGCAAAAGRDKLTLIASPGIVELGAWLEQLLAESTGKQGKGITPVDREPLGAPGTYGKDRLFVYVRLAEAPDGAQDEGVAALAAARHPIVRIDVPERYDLGQELFRWEMATAVAGAIIGINPFDQPDVDASKVESKRLVDLYETTGTLPLEDPFAQEGPLSLFADERNRDALVRAAGPRRSVRDYLRTHLSRLSGCDYCALLAYLGRTTAREHDFERMRDGIRSRARVATCVGFWPRYLHSTGQAYKGGPNSGVFLLLTCDEEPDVSIPGRRASFGVVESTQARGDLAVLAGRGRRALRVHLGRDPDAGLGLLADMIRGALA